MRAARGSPVVGDEVGRGRGADPMWTAGDRRTTQFSFDSLSRLTSPQTHCPHRPPSACGCGSQTKEREAPVTTGTGKGASGWAGPGWGFRSRLRACTALASWGSSNSVCGF